MRLASVLCLFILLRGACAASTVAPSPDPSQAPAASPAETTAPPSTASATLTPAATGAPVSLTAGVQLRVVSFAGERLGWAAGGNRDGSPFLMQTTDGGQTWSALPAPGVYIGSGDQLVFVDAQHGWLRSSVPLIPGGGGSCSVPSTAPPACRSVILRTDDGGHSWQEQLGVDQPSKLGPGIRALTVLDTTHAWGVRLPAVPSDSSAQAVCTPFDCAIDIVATTDGKSWSHVGDLPAFVDDLQFVDPADRLRDRAHRQERVRDTDGHGIDPGHPRRRPDGRGSCTSMARRHGSS